MQTFGFSAGQILGIFPFSGSAFTQHSIFSTMSTSCSGCDQCIHIPWSAEGPSFSTQLQQPHCAVWSAGVDGLCLSLVIITWHLVASLAVKALVASPEWREL